MIININYIYSEDKQIISTETILDSYSFYIDEVNNTDDLNLPNTLEVFFDDDTSDKLDIKWDGDIDFNNIGIYELVSSFVDETYSFDDMPKINVELKEKAQLRNNNIPEWDVKLRVNNGSGKIGIASENYPAIIAYQIQLTDLNNLFTLYYDINVKGLTPNTTYIANVGASPIQRITEYFDKRYYDTVPQEFTTDDNGDYEGTLRFTLWDNSDDNVGLVKTTLVITNENEKHIINRNDQFLNYIREGFDINKTRLIDPDVSHNNNYTTIPLNKDHINDKYLDLEIHFIGYKPNTEYSFRAQLYKIDGATETYIGDIATTSGTSDDKGLVEAHATLGPYNDLEPGRYYTLITAYANNSAYSGRYKQESRAQTTVYVFEVKETKAEVPIKIYTLDDNDKLLENAKVILRKDNENGEIVAEWNTINQAHLLALTPGTYYLEETITPSPYIKPNSFTFTLTIDEETTSESSLVGASILVEGDEIEWKKMFIYGENDFEDLVYCVNLDKHGPSLINSYTNNTLNFTEIIVDGNVLRDYTVSKMDPDELYDNVARILWNGYPNNMGNIKEKFDLKDWQFEIITQNAIHHYTDGRTTDHFDGVLLEAYEYLLNINNPAPKDMILSLYIADHNAYQNLIGASFRNVSIVEIKYKHIKEEEPKKKEEPRKEVPNTVSK